MKKFLFNKDFLEFNTLLQKGLVNKKIFFINKLNGKEDFFFFDENKNFFSLKKKLQKIYVSNTRGFVCLLELIGLGFSVTAKQNILRFNVGFNHSIYYNVPQDVIVRSKRKSLFIFSNSFFSLRKVVIDLKNFRKLSVYKLKGIKEKDDLYIKKN
jgi:ribosomal protein L6P/L9E